MVADEIKAQWAGNFFHGGRGDFLVVAEHEGSISGFCRLLLQDSGETLHIDLIPVSTKHHGRGVASAMIRFASAQCGSARRCRVATQGANIPSLRLDERLGFRICQTHYVLHAHGIGIPR